MSDFATGKISDRIFQSAIYPHCGSNRDDIRIPSLYGVDVSIATLPGGLEMAMTSDPLSLIPSLGLQESAWLSVQLAANDMATTGVAPMYAQFVLNLPPSLNEADFEVYWHHIHQYCKDIGTAITGGHTGKFAGQESTVAGGVTMIATARAGTMLTSNDAVPGDVLVITKGPALVAGSILALSFPQTVVDKCGKEIQQAASGLFWQTSALATGIIAAGLNTPGEKNVTAMHDVTEGGLLGAVYEMAQASGCGVVIEKDKLPAGEAQAAVCKVFDIDPLYCVGAGAMVIAVKEAASDELIQQLHKENIAASIVGKFTGKDEGLTLVDDSKPTELSYSGTDPYWNAFFTAIKNGWK